MELKRNLFFFSYFFFCCCPLLGLRIFTASTKRSLTLPELPSPVPAPIRLQLRLSKRSLISFDAQFLPGMPDWRRTYAHTHTHTPCALGVSVRITTVSVASAHTHLHPQRATCARCRPALLEPVDRDQPPGPAVIYELPPELVINIYRA